MSPISFWRWNLSAWFLFGVVCLLAGVYFSPDLPSGLALLAANLALVLPLSGVLRLLYRRTQLTDFFALKTLVPVVFYSFIAAFLWSGSVQYLVNFLEWGNPRLPREIAFSHRLTMTWLVFLTWSIGYYGLKAKMAAHEEMFRGKKSRSEARHLELQLLRNRVAPHFLFNSLNGIAAEISPHPAAASELIHDLSDYLRYLLDHRDQSFSPLSEEIDAMSAYLKMEQMRFGDRLRVSLEASRSARRTRVPCYLLQPLVENAVKHARWPETGALTIVIRAIREEDTVTISVANTGELKPEKSVPIGHEGVGLSTLRRLLELHYPGRHEFTLSTDHDNVLATLTLRGEAK